MVIRCIKYKYKILLSNSQTQQTRNIIKEGLYKMTSNFESKSKKKKASANQSDV